MIKSPVPDHPKFKEALHFWFKLGWISFGGTAGHIALMHDFLVDKKKWISNSRFFHALSLCMLLPGPEAQQLAIYIGQQLHGKKGGVIAGVLFVLPSMLILLILSVIYVSFGNLPWIYSLFNGLKPAVIALIIIALFRVANKSLKSRLHYFIAALAFLCIFIFNVSLLLIIVATIAIAVIIHYLRPQLLLGDQQTNEQELADEKDYYINKTTARQKKTFRWKDLVVQLTVFLLLWLFPLVCCLIFLPGGSFWQKLILFFTQTAFFTIGGSYTVLPYVAQFAVGKFAWLSKLQMIDGFALAETTPGPLIIVVGFVGFMAGYNHFHASLLMASIALLVTVFYTFLPCFLYIFAGEPLIERSHGNDTIGAILKLVTAAVVGVILNLTVYLGKDVIFPGGVQLSHLDVASLIWVLIALLLLKVFKINIIYLILLSMGFGLLRFLTGI
jgi:chromate transporter